MIKVTSEFTKERHMELLDYYLTEVKAREALENQIKDLKYENWKQNRDIHSELNSLQRKLDFIKKILNDEVIVDDIERWEDHYYED